MLNTSPYNGMQITNLLTTIHNNKIAIYNIYNKRERERERERKRDLHFLSHEGRPFY
jgi:hypothetical protein